MNGLIHSIAVRPYVFAFLIAYLFLAVKLMGWRKTICWLATGYLIAWASEYSSINNGFPYGEYHYIYESLKGELIVGGVPFFDSLSYTFLTFAGFAMAIFMLGRDKASGFIGALLGGILTMFLDVITDPIATMGDLWFLGKIHFYAHPGIYFGVPMTNFGGWFLVAFAIIGFNLLTWSAFPNIFHRLVTPSSRRFDLLYPAFYAGIALFNIAISFWVGQWKLGLASTAILTAIVLSTRLRQKLPN